MMEDFVKQDLAKEEATEFNKKLTQHMVDLMRISRLKMQEKYDDWDHFDEIYRGIKNIQDSQDRKQQEKKAPEKQVIPLGFAQVQTFIAFCFSVYFQREYFYELLGNSPEAEHTVRLAEGLLQRDLDKNKFQTILYQFLLDVGRFGLGVMKNCWESETQMVEKTEEGKSFNLFGMNIPFGGSKTYTEEQVSFEGNKITNVSPYKFFPDTRLPLNRFQEGEFCGHDNEYSYGDLKRMEEEGTIVGVDNIPTFTQDLVARSNHQRTRFDAVDITGKYVGELISPRTKGTILVTEVQVKLIPSKFKVNGKPLGPETTQRPYLVWLANDSRVIRCEPLSYAHGHFTYYIGEFTPDMNHLLNAGLMETVDGIQDVISWLINSHITSVRRVIQNRLVVDPEGVNMEDLKQSRPVIRLLPGAARSGVERWVHQLQVQDTTNGHMGDAAGLQDLLQVVTGINDNMLGQYNTGRRSATEARNVTASAASRLKMVAIMLYASSLEPLGRDMLANLRQGLSVETFVRVFGSAADPMVYQQLKPVRPEDLQGTFDFRLFDGTLPSEKSYIAETLKEVLVAVLSNPEALAVLQMSPQKLLMEVLELKGVRYPQRFMMTQSEQQLLVQTQQMQNGQTGPNVQGGPGQVQPPVASVGGA